MASMICLDDAMYVLLQHGFIDKGYIDDDGNAEVVRNELEQKCYLMLNPKDDKEMDKLRIENAQLIERILQLEKELTRERSYNIAITSVINRHLTD